MHRRTFVARLLAVLACAALAPAALAQGYPAKPIRLQIGYMAGGSAEAGARPLARALEPLLGQPLVFEYRPGNAGGVAMEFMARAPADGYTLYYFDSGPLTVAPHLNKVGYDNLASFTYFGHVCGSGSLLVVHSSTPFKSMQEVIERSKKEPNKWSYGTSGVGGPHHLSGEYFKSVTGADLLHVPYKGGGPAMTDLMGGQIPMLFSSLGPAVGAVRSGKIRALAVTSLTRSAAFPDVPTMDELGLKGFDSTAWYGLLAPAKTSAAIVSRLNRDFVAALKSPDVVKQLNARGIEADASSPSEYLAFARSEQKRWLPIIKEANIKAE